MERLVMDLRAALERVRPWALRADGAFRVGVLALAARMLVDGGAAGILIGIWLALSAVGVFLRRIWAWRVSLLGDIAIVVGCAITMVESDNLQLFSTIAGAAVADVVLLALGQSALEVAQMPPPPNAAIPDPDR